MANKRLTNVRLFCSECNMAIATRKIAKTQMDIKDIGDQKHCPSCKKHVATTVKDQKKSN